MKLCALLVVGLISLCASAQVRHSKLVIGNKEHYELKETDIIVVDTLLMMDSARLILNKQKPDNFVHAKTAIFLNGCVIDGRGTVGVMGRNGRTGTSPLTPCTDGGKGIKGTDGAIGGRGTNLSLHFTNIIIRGSLVIDLTGGNAGNGGLGGDGGGGGPGTRICPGGDGGVGGPGADGGNGGDGGSLTFVSPRANDVRLMLGNTITVRNFGGNFGLGGLGGAGGYAGLSPDGVNALDGKPGKKGRKGTDGAKGKPGPINFQSHE